jgi:hypothetical protein
MEEILRDQIWTFIGTILALFAIIVTVVIYLLQRNKKLLTYQILTNTQLFKVGEKLKGKLEMIYDGIPVKNMFLVMIRIENNGNQSITSQDFEKPISIFFGDEAKILNAEVEDVFPKNLKPVIAIEKPNQIVIQPLLLNKKEGFVLKFLFQDYGNIIEFDARISGIREVYKIYDRRGIPLFSRVKVRMFGSAL